MTASALVLVVPEAEPLVGGWRARRDPVAAQGMPAHVTVLYPFMDSEAVDAGCIDRLSRLFAAIPAPTLTFSRIDRFPNALWLAPDPADAVTLMTKAVVAGYPEYPPYGGAFADPIPHLTVAQGDKQLLDETEAGIRAEFTAPIVAPIRACALFAMHNGRWCEQRRFALG